jgi:endoglucanase Acf2
MAKSVLRCTLYAALAVTSAVSPVMSQVAAVGKGGYLTVLPAGRKTPSDSIGNPVDPQITADFSQPVISNKWWSSFLYKRVPNAHHNSGKSYPHPLGIRGAPTGLEMSYTTQPDSGMAWEWQWAGGTYEYGHNPDLVIGIDGMNIFYSKAASYSDWAVTADWTDATYNLRATMAHGNPYVFFKLTGGNAKVACGAAPTVWYNQNGVLGITVNGHDWGVFGPSGSAWTVSGNNFISTLAGKNYLSAAILPDNLSTLDAKNQALALFTAHAYAFVSKTHVDWAYDEKNALVTAVFTTTTDVKEGSETQTLQALYRHQWMHSTAPLTNYTYSSARGRMKLLAGNQFTTVMPFTGILPVFPDKGYDKNTLSGYVNNETGFNIPDSDPYNTGKAMGRVAMLAPIAEQIGNTTARTTFVNKLETKLQLWFTATAGKTSQVFFYNQKWNCLFGYPASFYSETEINDHHFHYGYFLMGAAAVAEYDPTWARPENWGGMVEMLIRDVANWDETNTMFPRLRNFDVYEGHAWAHGSEYYGRGNNQESSSESMDFNTGLYLYGLFTKNKTLRDLGAFLYTTEAAAIEQYWFDVDKAVFPSFYPDICVGQVMSNGGTYNTFFGASANYVHLINFLPLNTGSVYLGRHPAYMVSNINFMYNHPYTYQGRTGTWDDVAWGALSFGDPAAALQKFGTFGNYAAFDGESKAHIYHMVMNLNALGTVDTIVRADVPTYAVFDKGTVRTFVAYNPDDTARIVTFTDGTTVTVQPHAMSTATGVVSVSPGHSATRAGVVWGERRRVVSGYGGVRAALRNVSEYSIFSVDGKMVWDSRRGKLPRGIALGDKVYIVNIRFSSPVR